MESQRITHCSFDIFDTCLARTVASPFLVFRMMGNTLAELLPATQRPGYAESFEVWRPVAEDHARSASGREEITLREIWEFLGPLTGINPDLGVEHELRAERDVLRPIFEIASRIKDERQRGRKILFISDMYLPPEFLQDRLEAFGIFKPGDHLYVSSAIGTTKRSGGLFRHVLECEGISPYELYHVGDHPDADIGVPLGLGITAEYFASQQRTLAETTLIQDAGLADDTWISLAARLRSARLAHQRSPLSLEEGLVEDFLGPFLVVFGSWILQEARASGLERLYFAARDARLLSGVVRQLADQNGDRVDCRYLAVSRQAVEFPLVTEISEAGMPFLKRKDVRPALDSLLAKLGIPMDEFLVPWHKKFPKWRTADLLSRPEHWAAFWQILGSPPIGDPLRATITTRKAGAKAYFTEIGLLDDRPSALVDLGWSLSIQRSLNLLLADFGRNSKVSGLYFSLIRNRPFPAQAGAAHAFLPPLPPDFPQDRVVSAFLSRLIAFEHIIGIADHPSVAGYAADGSILYREPALSAEDRTRFLTVETALTAYVERSGSLWTDFATDRSAAITLLENLCRRFFQDPNPRSIAAIQHLRFEGKPLGLYRWRDLLADQLPERLARKFGGHYVRSAWPEASVSLSGPVKRFVSAAIRQAKPYLRHLSPR